MENSETAEARARVDVALALTLRDGGLRVSEAAALTWKDVERVKGGEISYHVGVDVQRLCQGNGPAIMSVVAVSSQ